jgi:hypothetical protein
MLFVRVVDAELLLAINDGKRSPNGIFITRSIMYLVRLADVSDSKTIRTVIRMKEPVIVLAIPLVLR